MGEAVCRVILDYYACCYFMPNSVQPQTAAPDPGVADESSGGGWVDFSILLQETTAIRGR